MDGVELFTVPKLLTVTHHPDVRACVATWLQLSTPRFRELVTRAMNRCAELGVLTWIADISVGNPGVPSQADARWVAAGCGGLSAASGIIAVVTVKSQSLVATMGTKRLRETVGARGGSVHECGTVGEALELAAEIAAKAKGAD